MDTTLEEYIASNAELQETLNCVKAQLKQSKMGKLLLNGVADFAGKSPPSSEEDEDIMDICIGDQERVLWKGPSSEKSFLSLHAKDDEEVEMEFEKMSSELKKVEINEPAINKIAQNNEEFDLRQLIDKKRFGANMPSVTSQQWRLRDPNVGRNRPAGMPPLVPIELLDELANTSSQKLNESVNNQNRKRWRNKNYSYAQKKHNNNYRTKSFKQERPKVWDIPIGNANTVSANASLNMNENAQPMQNFLPNQNLSMENVFFPNGVGGFQILPLGTVWNAATAYLNGNIPAIDFMSSIPYQGGIYSNQAKEQNNDAFERSNLHGIRRGGRVDRLQHDGSQNFQMLQRALKIYLNAADNDGNGCATNVNEEVSKSLNDVTSLATLVQNMLKQGITIKLAKQDVEC